MIYRLMKDGNPAYYRLKCVRVDGMDDRHLIIGVSNLEEKLSDEDRSQVHSNGIVTFYRIAKALSQDYFSIYYMDADMDHFMEYSSSDEYRKLGIEKEGNDFFEMIRKNSEKLIHPDDRERVSVCFHQRKRHERDRGEQHLHDGIPDDARRKRQVCTHESDEDGRGKRAAHRSGHQRYRQTGETGAERRVLMTAQTILRT